jgi:hypothetical protein
MSGPSPPSLSMLPQLTPPPDAGGDSTMHSSASDDEMFPDEAVSNNTALAPDTSASPPPSQAPRDSLASSVNANGKRPLTAAAASLGTHTDADTGYTWTRPEDQPGWEWKNTRAREDEIRALDSIVDQAGMVKSKFGLGGELEGEG